MLFSYMALKTRATRLISIINTRAAGVKTRSCKRLLSFGLFFILQDGAGRTGGVSNEGRTLRVFIQYGCIE